MSARGRAVGVGRFAPLPSFPMPAPLTCPAFTAAFTAAPASVECVPVAGELAATLAGLAAEMRAARAEFWSHWDSPGRDAAAVPFADARSRIYAAVADAVSDATGGFPGAHHAVVILPDSGDVALAGLLAGAYIPCVRREDHGYGLEWFASHNGRPYVGCRADAATAVAVAAGLTPAPVSHRRRARAAAAATPATPATPATDGAATPATPVASSLADLYQQACATAVAEHDAATAAVSARLTRLRQLCDAALID